MKKNVGGVERGLRFLAGAAILSFAFVGPQSPWAYLGIIPMVTGLSGFCLPYHLFGVSTCEGGSCAASLRGK